VEYRVANGSVLQLVPGCFFFYRPKSNEAKRCGRQTEAKLGWIFKRGETVDAEEVGECIADTPSLLSPWQEGEGLPVPHLPEASCYVILSPTAQLRRSDAGHRRSLLYVILSVILSVIYVGLYRGTD